MEKPVYLYYKLDNFYQNHRTYVKSVNYDQLGGDDLPVSDLDDCSPIKTNAELGFEKSHGNIGFNQGINLVSEAAANPCGLIARSFFNDTYALSIDDPLTAIGVDETDIAWDSDEDHKFGKPDNSGDIQWIDPTNEHFIVWMRTAGMPNFRKLWGRIHIDLQPDTYRLVVANNYDVSAFDGKKTFVMSTTNAFGGKNYFLAICYIVVGSLCFVFAAIFAIAHFVNSRLMKNESYASESNHVHAE
jgi:hypothetical protein